MKIYDISQKVFDCDVYPGDPVPKRETIASITNGDPYNLTAFSMCAHNGTHIDAPSHFIKDGATVSDIDLSQTVGYAYVADFAGEMSGNDAREILSKARELSPEAAKRILIRGEATVTEEAAEVFADSGILLLGTESQSVGPIDKPMSVHVILLSRGIVLLEGVRLSDVSTGKYLLSAAPILLNECEGSPCRAILVDPD